MTNAENFYPSTASKIIRTLHISMEYTYLTHIPNSTYIEKYTSFLCNNALPLGSLPDNWRIWTDANYTYKFTTYLTSPMGTAPTLRECNMMSTNMNSINLTTHGLTKDTQGHNDGNCDISL